MTRHAGPTQKSRWQLTPDWTSVPDDVILNRARHSGQHGGNSSENPVRRALVAAPEIMEPDLCPPSCPGRINWKAGVRSVPGHATLRKDGKPVLVHVPAGTEEPLLPPEVLDTKPVPVPKPLPSVVNDPIEIVRHLVNRNTQLEADNERLARQVESARAETAKYRKLFSDLSDALEIMKDAIKEVENRGG
jgi:hypothetical protein